MENVGEQSVMKRTDLHKLIDGLPESKLPIARAYLEGLRDGTGSPLDTAPYDDEPYTEKERKAVEEARAEAARGEVFTLEEIERELSL